MHKQNHCIFMLIPQKQRQLHKVHLDQMIADLNRDRSEKEKVGNPSGGFFWAWGQSGRDRAEEAGPAKKPP